MNMDMGLLSFFFSFLLFLFHTTFSHVQVTWSQRNGPANERLSFCVGIARGEGVFLLFAGLILGQGGVGGEQRAWYRWGWLMEGGATDCSFFLFPFLSVFPLLCLAKIRERKRGFPLSFLFFSFFLSVFRLLCLAKLGERKKGFKLFYLMLLVCFSLFSLSIFNFICAEVETRALYWIVG